MKHALLSIFILAISLQSFSQSTDSIVKLQLKVRHIKGLYNSKEKTFYSKNIDSLFNEHEYSADKYYGNIAILKYSYINKKIRSRPLFETYGITDTTGNILVPCIYDKLDIPTSWITLPENDKTKPIYNFSYFLFTKDDTSGIVASGNKVIYKIADPRMYRIYPMMDSIQNDIDYCKILVDSLFGLFSFNLERVIVPPKFKEVNIYNDLAICRSRNSFTVYNCLNGNFTQEFRLVRCLKNGSLLAKDNNNKLLVCNNIFDPEKSRNKNLTQDSIVEYFNHHFLLLQNGKYGIVSENEKTVIPFVYEDIYFFNLNFLLVKLNGHWAISNYKHELLSAFEFIDVEKQNAINFKNFMRFINEDTIVNDRTSSLKKDIQTNSRKLNEKINSHILSDYGDYLITQYALKKKDGFHIASLRSSGDNIQVDTTWWDNVYLLPGDWTIGVQKGKKFGYYDKEKKVKKYLKYDGIYFVPEAYWSVLGSHGSPYLVVRKGYTYYQYTPEREKWWRWLFVPPNYPNTYIARPRWVKYIKETELISKRNKG